MGLVDLAGIEPATFPASRDALNSDTNRVIPKVDSRGVVYKFGGPGRDRTGDLFHAMEARSQLRHRPTLRKDDADQRAIRILSHAEERSQTWTQLQWEHLRCLLPGH